jgi:hypothetical protein
MCERPPDLRGSHRHCTQHRRLSHDDCIWPEFDFPLLEGEVAALERADWQREVGITRQVGESGSQGVGPAIDDDHSLLAAGEFMYLLLDRTMSANREYANGHDCRQATDNGVGLSRGCRRDHSGIEGARETGALTGIRSRSSETEMLIARAAWPCVDKVSAQNQRHCSVSVAQ